MFEVKCEFLILVICFVFFYSKVKCCIIETFFSFRVPHKHWAENHRPEKKKRHFF